MFKENQRQEMAIRKRLISIHMRMRWHFKERMELKKRGASVSFKRPHFDRKIRKCYPRGEAFLRMVDLHTIEWLNTDGRVDNG